MSSSKASNPSGDSAGGIVDSVMGEVGGLIPGINTGGGGFAPDLGGGPSNAGNNSQFTGGVVNMGSNNGVPTWALVGGALIAAYFIFGRKRGKK